MGPHNEASLPVQAPPAAPGPPDGGYAVQGQPPSVFAPQMAAAPTGFHTTGKPGTVTGAQVLLWIIAGLAVVSAVFAVVGLATFVTAAGVAALSYALYMAVQSSVCAVALGGGRRWARIWALVSTIVNLVLAVVGFVTGLFYLKFTPVPFISGGIATALYGTLFGLLLVRSLRQWVLVRRVERGEVPLGGLAGLSGGVAPASQGAAPAAGFGAPPQQDPGPRPRSIVVTTVAVAAVGALWAWFVWNLIRAIGWYGDGEYGRGWEFTSLIRQWWFWEIHGVVFWGGPIVMVGALVTGITLWRGRAAGRILGIVWLSVAVLALAYRMQGVTQYYLDLPPYMPRTRVLIDLGLGFACLALMLFALVMLFLPGVRQWTPLRPLTLPVLVVHTAGHGQQAAPPSAYRGPNS
jgi:hypothetical protein